MEIVAGLNDFTVNVQRALSEIDLYWKHYNGLIICGTHNPEMIEVKIKKIQEARMNKIPFLGICFGYQLAAIEYARNILKVRDAVSEEFGSVGTFVVKKRKEGLKVGLHNGESYWNNYEVDPEIEKKWQEPAWFFTSQYHPEYQSSREKPHPLLKSFLEYAKQATMVP